MKVKDGYIMLAIGNDAQFICFCQSAGCAELASNERFTTNNARVTHRTELETAH